MEEGELSEVVWKNLYWTPINRLIRSDILSNVLFI